jgi:serine/threonine protein kinase
VRSAPETRHDGLNRVIGGGKPVVPQPPLVEPLRRWDPEQVGGYALIGRLGAGAMGQVYLGRSAAGRLVAVKTIKTELAEEPDFRTRFGQEVAAARRVSGAFTAAVVAADSEADVPWLATVYVPAPSLSGLVRSCGPLPAAAVRWLAAGCAEALESIHSVGLVHRDLKPGNVLVSPDGPRVIDFGVARAAERIQLTVTRGSIGTPAYMAPEQARDTRQATAASDIFSLGATMLFAATGHAPYQGETVIDVLVRLATQEPDLTGLPGELADIVVPCLERDPRNRPTSASILARLAPELAGDGELASAPLPGAALELIEEYRRTPRAPVQGGDEIGTPRGAVLTTSGAHGRGNAGFVADDDTLGSQPLAASADRSHPPRRFAGPGRARRLTVAGLGAAVASAALVFAGWAIADYGHGRAAGNTAGQKIVSGRGTSPSPSATSDTLGRGSTSDGNSNPLDLGPAIQPPPGGLPPGGQPSGALDGPPGVGVSQLTGDSNTIFVIHGQNWPPDKPLTVILVGIGTSPIHPLADNAGMFSYAINQDHEFFRGGLPLGIYTVRVTDAGGARAQARFDVNAR